MSILIDSPYFTGEEDAPETHADLESTQESTNESTNESTVDTALLKLQKMFPNKVFHMKVLLKLYDFCFPRKPVIKPVFEKTQDEILEDIKKTTITLNLENMLTEQTEALKQYYTQEELLDQQVAKIPMFLDFAYLYYAWCYDKEAPIYKLPNTPMKFNIICEALNSTNDNLTSVFSQCIKNNFIKDLRIEQPPFMLRTDLTKEEIREKINSIVKPLCKEILNGLFALNTATSKSTHTLNPTDLQATEVQDLSQNS